MKVIRLSGREQAVLRSLDFASGTKGAEIVEHTKLATDDFVDIVNGLMDAGYVECDPYREHVTEGDFSNTTFEVNPSYAHDLRSAMRKSY